jgi:hypothetical protein
MPSFQAAREEAIRGAIDLLDGLQLNTVDLSSWWVRLWDENGELLRVIDGQVAAEARRAGDDANALSHRL